MAVVVVNAGRAITTNRLKGAGTEPSFVAWGIGTTTAAVTQTALVTESAPTSTSRGAGTSTQQTTTVTNDSYRVVGTVTAGSTLAITEAGLFDAATAGNMFLRGDFAAINVVSGDAIQFTFTAIYA
jgi:hypothetical protein